METKVGGSCNGSNECQRNTITRKNVNVVEKYGANQLIASAAAVVTSATVKSNAEASAGNGIDGNNNNSHNHNSKSSYNLRSNKKCDFFNFATILFAIFMIVNVQFSFAIIEIQNEKEKHGE